MNLARHREYIRIVNKNNPLCCLTNKELHILHKETPSIEKFFEVEDELKRRGAIRETFNESINKMTGGSIQGTEI